MGRVISRYDYYLWVDMFVCFHVLLGGLLWCGGLLWLVVSAVVYRCDLMCKLIKLHTRGCIGGQIRSDPEDGHKVARNMLSNL